MPKTFVLDTIEKNTDATPNIAGTDIHQPLWPISCKRRDATAISGINEHNPNNTTKPSMAIERYPFSPSTSDIRYPKVCIVRFIAIKINNSERRARPLKSK